MVPMMITPSAVPWLRSDASSFVTGQALETDG
jgi:hypothetical protein